MTRVPYLHRSWAGVRIMSVTLVAARGEVRMGTVEPSVKDTGPKLNDGPTLS